MVLTQYDLEDMLDKSKGRPKYFALRLAEKLFGIDVLIKSTPYGIGGKVALHPVILDAIKGILIFNLLCVVGKINKAMHKKGVSLCVGFTINNNDDDDDDCE